MPIGSALWCGLTDPMQILREIGQDLRAVCCPAVCLASNVYTRCLANLGERPCEQGASYPAAVKLSSTDQFSSMNKDRPALAPVP